MGLSIDNPLMQAEEAQNENVNPSGKRRRASVQKGINKALLSPPVSIPPTPRAAKPRHPDDLYAPLLIRGQGASKEGRCPHCPHEAWFRLKQSAYWYHLNYRHGISAATGLPFPKPAAYRSVPLPENEAQVEAGCKECGAWILLTVLSPSMRVNVRDLSHAPWYRHAQKCNPGDRLPRGISYERTRL